jgi:hypothetical protein
MKLNGWSFPQMLRRYGARTRRIDDRSVSTGGCILSTAESSPIAETRARPRYRQSLHKPLTKARR